jgi:carboxylate-amine ligase
MKLADDAPGKKKKTTADGARPKAPLEELSFHGSATPTLGVEMEFQVLDRESGDLAPGAPRILPACQEQKIAGVSAELLQSMIEIKTDVCNNVGETRSQLLARIKQVRNIASSLGYDLSMGGTHPFARTTSSTIFPAERYESIKERMGWLTYQIVVYGLHVHVGVPSGDMAIGVTNALVQYLPHLLALSANSPYWQGVDTNLASTRAVLFRLSPNVGVPHYFPKWNDFANYVEVMRACRAIRNTKDIHWDIRPRPQTGTIEFRVCDMPGSLADTFAIVALIRALVTAAQRTLEEKPRLRRGDLRTYWVVPENKWLAAR